MVSASNGAAERSVARESAARRQEAKKAKPKIEAPSSVNAERCVVTEFFEEGRRGGVRSREGDERRAPARRWRCTPFASRSSGGHGLDAEMVIIPPFGLPNGVKTNGEMAAMVFQETQAKMNAPPAEPSALRVQRRKAWHALVEERRHAVLCEHAG